MSVEELSPSCSRELNKGRKERQGRPFYRGVPLIEVSLKGKSTVPYPVVTG